jgi:hypothetical protein
MQFLVDDERIGHLILEVAQVEGLIHQMAFLRSAMADPVPADLVPGTKALAVENPTWTTRVQSAPTGPGIVLALRHPGLGWLVHFLPPETARSLARSLSGLSQRL